MAHGRPEPSASYKPPREEPPQLEKSEVGSHQNARIERSFEELNETSPLVSPQHPRDDESLLRREFVPLDALNWQDGEVEPSKSTWYLFILALSIGG